jgi:hypothetical protein
VGGICSTHGEGEVFTGFWLRPEGKRPLRRHRRMWEDNIKMDVREIGIDGENLIQLAQDEGQLRSFMNMVMCPRVP